MANWTVSNYYKKSVEEHEKFLKDDQYIIRKTGWRYGSWNVITSDDRTPDFYWIADDNPEYASININDYSGSNIEEVEFIETFDGCWEDYEFSDNISEEEQEAIMNIIEEEGFWELENQGWYPDDCDCYIIGPMQIDNDAGETITIVCSDAQGNTVNFKDVHKEVSLDEYINNHQWEKADITDELQDVFQKGLGNDESNVIDSKSAWPFPEPKEVTPVPVWPFPTGHNDKEIK